MFGGAEKEERRVNVSSESNETVPLLPTINNPPFPPNATGSVGGVLKKKEEKAAGGRTPGEMGSRTDLEVL